MLTSSTRLLRLLSLLQTRRHWVGAELAERLDVHPRTLRRDVDRLRQLGYPVQASSGVAGGYAFRAGQALPPLLLDDEEALAVSIALRTATAGAVDDIEEPALRALVKLEQVMPLRLREQVDALRSTILPLGRVGPVVEASLLATLGKPGSPTDGRDLSAVYNLPKRGRAIVPPNAADIGAQYCVAAGWASPAEYFVDRLAAGVAPAVHVLELVDLTARAHHFPHQLSGGEKQRLAIARAIINQGRTIRIPVYVAELINKVVKTASRLQQELQREPTEEEISREVGLSIDRVREMMRVAVEPISLETPIGEEEDSSLGDFIEDKNIINPSEAVISLNLSEQTRKVLSTLTPREEKVLRMRFGIGEESDHTLEEVGQDFNVTRERIRQIEAKALRKLRHPSRSGKLKAFIE